MRLDGGRISNKINRIIKGLYFEVTKTPLPKNATVNSMQFSEFKTNCDGNAETMQLIQAIPQLQGGFIGNDTFEFRYCIDEASLTSIWFMESYRRIAFAGTTGFSESVEDLPPSAS